MPCFSPSDWLALSAVIVAVLSFFLTFWTARVQLKTFTMTLLAGKAVEINQYSDRAEKDPAQTILYEHALSTIVQATEIYELLLKKHKFLLFKIRPEVFMDAFFLQWRTHMQNSIFDDGKFEQFLIQARPVARIVIQSYFKRIKFFMQGSRNRYPAK